MPFSASSSACSAPPRQIFSATYSLRKARTGSINPPVVGCGTLKVMPVPIDFLRGLVGVIGVGCAYMLARVLAALQKGQVRISKFYTWLLRLTLCIAAVWYPVRGSVDTVDLVIWVLAAISFGAGYWDAARQKKQEDLTHEMFPDSNEEPE